MYNLHHFNLPQTSSLTLSVVTRVEDSRYATNSNSSVTNNPSITWKIKESGLTTNKLIISTARLHFYDDVSQIDIASGSQEPSTNHNLMLSLDNTKIP